MERFPSSVRQLAVNSYSQAIAGHLQNLGNWLASFLVRHWLGLINLFLVIVILGSLLAPYLAFLGHLSGSKIIYSAYHITCLQKEGRCLYVFGYEMGVCARCFSIYLSFLVLGLLWGILVRLKTDIKPVKFKLAFLFAIPLILDGSTQALGFRESNNLLRIITGFCLSLGIMPFVYPPSRSRLWRASPLAGRPQV